MLNPTHSLTHSLMLGGGNKQTGILKLHFLVQLFHQSFSGPAFWSSLPRSVCISAHTGKDVSLCPSPWVFGVRNLIAFSQAKISSKSVYKFWIILLMHIQTHTYTQRKTVREREAGRERDRERDRQTVNTVQSTTWKTAIHTHTYTYILGMHRIAICIILQEPDSTG